jgi:hypothetical protein
MLLEEQADADADDQNCQGMHLLSTRKGNAGHGLVDLRNWHYVKSAA